MYSRFVLINCPGLGVGDVRNSSSSNHSIEQLLKYALEKQLALNLTGLETIGFGAFVKYKGAIQRKSSVTARLASRSVFGNNDFDAMTELGGGDLDHLPVYSRFTGSGDSQTDEDVFVISIGNDPSIVPAFEFIEAQSDADIFSNLLDVISAPLVRNEFIFANCVDFRESALEANPTLACACLVQISQTIEDILPKLGADDGLMVVSTTAINATEEKPQFKNELTPMMYHAPIGQTHDLGLRLLSDVGPSIAEFFSIDRNALVGASLGKWMASLENPQEVDQSHIHS